MYKLELKKLAEILQSSIQPLIKMERFLKAWGIHCPKNDLF